MEIHIPSLVNALIFAVFGVIILVLSFIAWDKLTPYDLWKEIVHERNTALAIFAGAMALGIAIIVAASVH